MATRIIFNQQKNLWNYHRRFYYSTEKNLTKFSSIRNDYYKRKTSLSSSLSTTSTFGNGGKQSTTNGQSATNGQSSSTSTIVRESFANRQELRRAQRVVIKLGSAVITRDDECGLALGRLASIVEQVSELHKEGRDVLMVTSGAVAFGKQKLASELRMSMSMRETLSRANDHLQARGMTLLEPRAAAAVGQSGLMALYDAMFAQYGITIAQILINKTDFRNPTSRQNLASTVFELLKFDIIPIINTNDAVVSPALPDVDLEGVISVNDNDILAAHLAVEVNSDALFLLSDVNGIYTKPPKQEGARLLHTYDPSIAENITFGEGSRVGTGGMESKVNSAVWALNRGVSVVICNGMQDDAIANIMSGKRVGTFFTQIPEQIESTQAMIQNGKFFIFPERFFVCYLFFFPKKISILRKLRKIFQSKQKKKNQILEIYCHEILVRKKKEINSFLNIKHH